MKMNERMMAAVGTNAGDSWTRKMIEHHRGAVDMSNVVLGQSPTPEVAEMARTTITKQQAEIAGLERMVQQGAPAPQSAELYRPAMMQMHERMMAATGANPSETWMRKMAEHHKGAIDMSNVALAQQPSAQVREKAQKTRTDQQKESEKLERMMRGEPTEPKQAAATKVEPSRRTESAPKEKSAAAPKAAQPRAAEKSAAAPKAAPKAQPKAAPMDPHAGMDMNNM